MEAKQKRLIESYQRVKTFLETHPSPTTPGSTEAKAAFDGVVARLTDLSSAQVFGLQLSQAERQRVATLMKKLREHHMKPIVTIAKAEIEADPSIAKALRLPASKAGAVALLAAGKAMKDAAVLYQPVFVRAGRPENFLDQLTTAMEAVETAVSGQARNYGTKIGAGAGLSQELRRARRALEVLDPIVKIAFEGNEEVLAQWRAAKRVRALPGLPAVESPVSPVEQPDISPAPQPTPAAA